MIKKFAILQDIMLSFLEGNEQHDYLMGLNDGWTLECDGHTIWVTKGDKRHESITMANAVPLWLSQGKIKEIN